MYEFEHVASSPESIRGAIRGGGGGALGVIFAGHVPLAAKSPYPIIIYSVANYRPRLGHFWANMYTNFCDPNSVTFYIYELNHFLD